MPQTSPNVMKVHCTAAIPIILFSDVFFRFSSISHSGELSMGRRQVTTFINLFIHLNIHSELVFFVDV